MLNINPCPKCAAPVTGKNGVILDEQGYIWNYAVRECEYRVGCLNCKTITEFYDNRDDAINDWNNKT